MGADRALVALAGEAARGALGGEPPTSVIAATGGRVTVQAGDPGRAGVAVKVYRDPERLLQEHRHSRLARDLDLPVPEEVSFEAGPPAVLVTQWIAGEPIDRYTAAARDLGKLLARYHAAREVPADAAAGWAEQVRVRVATERNRVKDMHLLGGSEQLHVAQKLDDLVAAVGRRPQVLIHGDLQPEHVLVDASTLRIVAILDWADSTFADPLFEVARLSLLHPELERPFLSGLGLATDAALQRGYRVLWSVMSATWLAEHGSAGGAVEMIRHVRAEAAG